MKNKEKIKQLEAMIIALSEKIETKKPVVKEEEQKLLEQEKIEAEKIAKLTAQIEKLESQLAEVADTKGSSHDDDFEKLVKALLDK